MLTLDNTIIAGNDGSDIFGIVYRPNSLNNLIGQFTARGLTNGVNGNQLRVTNPGLGTLGYYGGSTETIPLLPGSPAIDAGSNTYNTASTDQRGDTRVVDGTVDIGAFESQASRSPPSPARPRRKPPSARRSPTRLA